MKIWRGNCGNGVSMDVVPCLNEGRRVSTTFRRFRGYKVEERKAWREFGGKKGWEEMVPEKEVWIVG